ASAAGNRASRPHPLHPGRGADAGGGRAAAHLLHVPIQANPASLVQADVLATQFSSRRSYPRNQRPLTTRLPLLLRSLRLLLVVAMVVLCAGVWGVSGLYEDQVGTYDWVQPRIGGVRFAAFLTSSQRKRVLVGTDRNVIAALNLRTGDIAWRRVLGDKDTLRALDMGGRYLVTLSGTKAAAVRAWAVPDGTLAWESVLPLPAAAAAGVAKFITIP
ncbi:unnamed protein product, partial [Closterium sp. NIES-54]